MGLDLKSGSCFPSEIQQARQILIVSFDTKLSVQLLGWELGLFGWVESDVGSTILQLG